MQYLDDALLDEIPRPAAQPKRWLTWAAAACLVLAVAIPAFLKGPKPVDKAHLDVSEADAAPTPAQGAGGETRPIVPGGVPGPDAVLPGAAEPEALAWNELEETRGSPEADVAGVMMVGEGLTAAQLDACGPEIREAWMAQFNGYASYYLHGGAGGLAYIDLTVTNAAWGGTSTVHIRDKDAPEPATCYVRPLETDKVGSYGGQEYRAYRLTYDIYPSEPWTELTVVFEKENVEYTLSANVPQAQEELAAADLRDLLLCYAGTHSAPDLSAFHCGEHLYRDEELTLAEALADPDFGAYLPAEGPEGFELVQLRRYQLEDTVNYLLAFWFTAGGEQLSWLIKPADADALSRVVDPAEPERYDWNRYGVPWSAYAAQENWLTIENPVFRLGDLTPELIDTRVHAGDEGALMCRFGVLFENGVVIEINAKGIDPDWLYDALTGQA